MNLDRYTPAELKSRLEALQFLMTEVLDDYVERADDASFAEPDSGSPLLLRWKTSAGFEATMTIDPTLGPLIRIPWPVIREVMRGIGERLAIEFARPQPYTDDPEPIETEDNL